MADMFLKTAAINLQKKRLKMNNFKFSIAENKLMKGTTYCKS